MKLNIGCGKKYIPDFQNIDLNEDLIADKITSAVNLDFNQNVSEEVHAIHIIEHLSYFEAIHALSEFFRVLKPNGKLIIEIPDLEKACQLYLKANEDQKKEVLGWIYGIPHKGLQHKFCFPINFLIETLNNIGFRHISTQHYFNDESIPSIRINCAKIDDAAELRVFQMIAELRKKIINENQVNFTDSFTTKEKEDLIDKIRLKSVGLKGLKADLKKIEIIEILIDVLIKSPKIAKFYFLCLKEDDLFSSSERTYLFDIIEDLIDINFPNILYQSIKRLYLNSGTQQIVYLSIETYAKTLIKKLLDPKEKRKEILKNLKNQFENINNSSIEFFSNNMLQQESLDYFYKGIKFFYNFKYKLAFKNFLEAIRLYRNDYLYYWNLARLLVQLNRSKEALKYYRWTQRLIKLSRIENKKLSLQNLKNEFKWLRTKKGLMPKFEPILA
ncbi:MAG: hypothetical protein ACFFBP_00620 [Promethearchaeota archaeon]